ncbi:type IV pilus modification PilV family protein [Persephonella sp.]
MAQIASLNKKGFTLVETLVAMFLFALILIFMLQSFLLAYKLNYLKLIKDEEVKIAQEELERLRNISYSNINNLCTGVCNNFDHTTANDQCKIQRQVRNRTVIFGREISVSETYPYKQVTITICSEHKDGSGNNISYTTTTIITDKGF